MKSKDLPRVIQPEPIKPPCCAACKAFRPEVIVPVGDGAEEMCWFCAHAVCEHGSSLEEAENHECECDPSEVYPADFMALRRGTA